MTFIREIEELPFTVRIAQNESDRERAAALRAQAYGRHGYAPGTTEHVGHVDDADRRALLLLAQDKCSGNALGTLRVSSSLRGTTPIPDEMPRGASIGATFTYLDRFAVASDAHTDIVMLALVKAQWFIAYHEGVQWILAAALPPLARRYRRLGMAALVENEGGQFRIPALSSAPYEAVGGRLPDMPARVIRTTPAVVPFFVNKEHPDIAVGRPALMDFHVHTAMQARQAPVPQAS